MQSNGTSVAAMEIIHTEGLADERISQRLAALIKQRSIRLKECRVVVLLPRSRAIMRQLRLPSSFDPELRSMIELQVVSDIPYSREEVEIDFEVLSRNPEGFSDVLVAILPIEVATNYWKIFNDAGIGIDWMTISSVGLWFYFRMQSNVPQRLSAVIDVDANRSEVCLCYPDHWWSSREVQVGIEQIKESSAEFLRQWQLTKTKVANDKPQESLKTVYLISTAGGLVEDLRIELAKQEGYEVRGIDISKALPVSKRAIWSGELATNPVSWASLAGIALTQNLPVMNLVPEALKTQASLQRQRRELANSLIWLAVALVMIGGVFGTGLVKKNILLQRAQDELTQAQLQAKKIDDRLNGMYAIEDMFADRVIFTALMEKIYSVLPEDVFISSINLSVGRNLSLEGSSANSASINRLQKALSELTVFSSVNLDYVNKRPGQNGEETYFKITSAIKKSSNEDAE